MASKKAAKDIVVAVKKGGALAKPGSLEERYARAAKAATASVPPPTSNVLSFSKTGMKYGGNKINGPLPLIILDYIRENNMYAEKYDPENKASPCCYAYGRDEASMRPHDKAKGYPVTEERKVKGKTMVVPTGEFIKPDSCAECPMNQWGSAPTGKGKACQNRWRLLALPADVDEDTVKTADWALIKLPVTSGKAFQSYVTNLARLPRAPWQVISEVDVEEDEKTQFQVTWKPQEDGDVPVNLLDAIEGEDGEGGRRAEAMAAIEQEYKDSAAKDADDAEDEDAKPAKRGKF